MSYLDLLPRELNEEFLLKITPREIFKICKSANATIKTCNNERFWLRKAIHDTDLDITVEFFNEYPRSGYLKYLRCLSYRRITLPGFCELTPCISQNAVVKGSELFLTKEFCFKQAIKEKIGINYFIGLIQNPAPFLNIAAKMGNVDLVNRLLKMGAPNNYDFVAYLSIYGTTLKVPKGFRNRVNILTLALQDNPNILEQNFEIYAFSKAIKILCVYGNLELAYKLVDKYPELYTSLIYGLIELGNLTILEPMKIPEHYYGNSKFAKSIAKSKNPYIYKYFLGLCPPNSSDFFKREILRFTTSLNPIFPLVKDNPFSLEVFKYKQNDPLAIFYLYIRATPEQMTKFSEIAQNIAPEAKRILLGEYPVNI